VPASIQVVIWDSTTGAEVASCKVTRWIEALQPFTTGRGLTRLAFGGSDSALGVWNPDTRSEVLPRLLQPNPEGVDDQSVHALCAWDDPASGRVLLMAGTGEALVRVYDCGPAVSLGGALRAANKTG
jgi:hypothetical protein